MLDEFSQSIGGVSVSIPPSFKLLDNQVIVGCGFPGRGELVDVKIVDRDTQALLDDLRVGDIWISSPSKSVGYWGHSAEDNKADFNAAVNQSSGNNAGNLPAIISSTGYLRTGDLGFLYNGELFVCGRSKDLIIIRGSNHYPQDIEKTAESSDSNLRPGCSAAFAVRRDQDDTEIIIYVAEVRLR
jgi:acyl-CoA synthetase (AMP-forming)/AMP-acid ligase II